MTTRPIRAFLGGDHERLAALLASTVTPAGGIDPTSYEQFRGGLLRHIGMEEKILFPASRRANGGHPHPTESRLHRDHGALALLLVPTPTPDLVREIRSILDGHNETEEGPDGIYDACDRLPRDELERVLREMTAYPAVKLAPHYDGPEVPRRAEDALRAVSREPRGDEPN